MAKPKLGTKTPDSNETNSLIDIHEELILAPKERRFAIVEFTVPEVVHHTGADSVAKIQITHIEHLPNGKQLDTVLEVMDERFQKRTGNKVRPAPDQEDTPLEGLGDVDDSV